MAFLDSLTDAFTGAPAARAAENTRGYLSGVNASNTGAINAGRNEAVGAIQGGTAAGRDALGAGYYTGQGATNAGADSALGHLQSGYDTAGAYYDQARNAFSPLSTLSNKYGGATSLALGALGANGADAQNAARGAFKAGPAYDFNLTQGLESINRRRSMGGMLDSGNADRDAQTFGAGLASNQYDTWMNDLLGFTNPELQATQGAATGIAGVNQNQAGAATTLGQNQAGIDTGRAAMLADLAKSYGLNSANLETGAGQNLANVYTGAAGQQVGANTAIAQPYANTYGQQAAAEQQGSGNLWNLVGNLGTAGANLYGRLNGPAPIVRA